MATPNVNIDDILFYVVEVNDDYDDEHMSHDEMKRLDELNETFINQTMVPKIISVVSPCVCQMEEYNKRQESRRKLLGLTQNMYKPEIQQADMDSFQFGVLVLSENGIFQSIIGIVRKCIHCDKIEIWGDAEIVTRTMAEIANQYYTHHADNDVEDVYLEENNAIFGEGEEHNLNAEELDKQGFIIENAETGEIIESEAFEVLGNAEFETEE